MTVIAVPGSGAGTTAAPLSPMARQLLRLAWQEREISRAELARRAAVSRSTVSEIVPGLLGTALVVEAGVGVSSGGRRPIMLRFDDDAFAILGVDLGATHVSVVCTDLRGRVRSWHHRDHPVQRDPAGTRALIITLCDEALAAAGVRRERLLALGVAVPSPVDPRHPERLHRLALPLWQQEHHLDEVGARFGVPVLIDNDANLGALAEHWWGAARGLDDFTYLKVATGIGSGHFMAGRIYRGATGTAGEAGHLTIDADGIPCDCGNRGCIVNYIGAPQLVARAQALVAGHPDSVLRDGVPSIRAIESAARAGDALALRVVGEAAEHLGLAITSILNLLNPAAIIVGGSLARLGDAFLAPVRESVARRTFTGAIEPSALRVSELGERGVAIGAATLVLDALLQEPARFPAIAGAHASPIPPS